MPVSELPDFGVDEHPPVTLPNGSIATVRSIGVGDDRGEWVIPTIVGGKPVSNDEAIRLWKSGKNRALAGPFKTVEEGNNFGQRFHESEARRISSQELPDFGPSSDLPDFGAPVAPKSGIPKSLLRMSKQMALADEVSPQAAQNEDIVSPEDFENLSRAVVADAAAGLSLLHKPKNVPDTLLPNLGNIKAAIKQNLPGAAQASGNIPAAINREPLPIDTTIREAALESKAQGEFPSEATVAKLSQGLAATAPMAAIAALPKGVQTAIMAGFTAKMLSDAPDVATALGDELGKPPEQQDPDKIATLVSDAAQITGFSILGGVGTYKGARAELTPSTALDLQRSLTENQVPKREIRPETPPPSVQVPVENAAPKPNVNVKDLPEGEPTENVGTTEPPLVPALSRGPGAAEYGEPGTYSAIQQLADQIRVTAPEEAPIQTKLPLMDQAKAKLQSTGDAVKDSMAKAIAVKDAIWDSYSKLPTFTDENRAVGRWTYALQKADFEARDFAKTITKAVPDKLRREAITNWIQADGDPAVLQSRADASKPAIRRGYEAALNLSPKETEIAQLVREYYDRQLDRGISEGILKDGLENYVTQVWQRDNPVTRRLKNELSAEKLQPNFKFARKRIFDSYFEGEQAGYAPANKDVGALLAFYDQSFNKSIAARAFLKELHEGKAVDGRPLVEVSGSGKLVDQTGSHSIEQGKSVVIKPHSKPEEIADYRVIDHPALRGWKWLTQTPEGSPVLLQGDLLVHPEIYQKLRNRLSISAWRQNPVGRAILNTQSTLKQTMLSVSGFHQAQETLHALGHRINPANLEKLDLTDPITKAGVEHGLQLADYHAMEAFSEGLSSGPLTNGIPVVGRRILKPYTEWLFQDYIPRLKLTMFKHALERNTKRYANELSSGKITQDQILETTSNQANAAFGELNYRYMGRNPTLQDTLRAFLLAPDFLEARGRFVGQSLKPHGREQLVALGLLASTMYITARVTNQIIDGDPHWEKEHAFSIVAAGHAYTLRSVPGDIMHLVSDPRSFSYHRLSPIIGRGSIEAITGRDDRGVKRDVLQQVKDMGSTAIPISLRKRDDMNIWESFLNAFGVGTRRYDAVQNIGTRVKEFQKKFGKKGAFEFVYDPDADRHRPLRLAISNNDSEAVANAYAELRKTESPHKIIESIRNYYTHPLTGSRADERKFTRSLDDTGKREYKEASDLRRQRLRFFLSVIAKRKQESLPQWQL